MAFDEFVVDSTVTDGSVFSIATGELGTGGNCATLKLGDSRNDRGNSSGSEVVLQLEYARLPRQTRLQAIGGAFGFHQIDWVLAAVVLLGFGVHWGDVGRSGDQKDLQQRDEPQLNIHDWAVKIRPLS